MHQVEKLECLLEERKILSRLDLDDGYIGNKYSLYVSLSDQVYL